MGKRADLDPDGLRSVVGSEASVVIRWIVPSTSPTARPPGPPRAGRLRCRTSPQVRHRPTLAASTNVTPGYYQASARQDRPVPIVSLASRWGSPTSDGAAGAEKLPAVASPGPLRVVFLLVTADELHRFFGEDVAEVTAVSFPKPLIVEVPLVIVAPATPKSNKLIETARSDGSADPGLRDATRRSGQSYNQPP